MTHTVHSFSILNCGPAILWVNGIAIKTSRVPPNVICTKEITAMSFGMKPIR